MTTQLSRAFGRKNIIEETKNGFWFLTHLFPLLSVLLLKYNPYLDIAIFALLSFYLVVNIKRDGFLLFFFVLTIMDDAFDFNFLNGSFSRIYEILFLLRIVFVLGSDGLRIKRTDSFYIILFFIASSFLYTHDITSIFSNFLNGVILIAVGQSLLRKKGILFEKVLIVICLTSIISGLYGATHNGFMTDRGMLRMYGAITDPNYSCFMYLLGFSSLLATKTITKKCKIVLGLVLLTLCFLTVSITGIIGFVFVFVLYSLFKKKRAFSLAVLIAIISIILIYFIGNIFSNSAIGYFANRINTVFSQLGNNDFSGATSLRTLYAKWYFNYFKELPTLNILFGGINPLVGQERDYFLSKFYNHISHNSFVDMLYMVGVVGTIVFVLYFCLKTINTFKLASKKSSHAIGSFLILFVCIYYMFSLSIFPYRFFFVFAMLEYSFLSQEFELAHYRNT